MGKLTTLHYTYIWTPVRLWGPPNAGFTDNAASYGVIVREILGQGRGELADSCPQLVAHPPKKIRD